MELLSEQQFYEAMKKGLGRCVLLLRELREKDPEKLQIYKPVVIDGCLNVRGFDPQCEGARERYFFTLARFFEEDDRFVAFAGEKLLEDGTDDPLMLEKTAMLLKQFAAAGNAAARDYLEKKKDALCRQLHKRAPGMDPCCESAVALYTALVELDGAERYLEAASFFGDLLLRKNGYRYADVMVPLRNFSPEQCQEFYETLCRSEDAGVQCYLQTDREEKEQLARLRESRSQQIVPPPTAAQLLEMSRCPEKRGELRGAAVRFSRCAGAVEKEALAKGFLSMEDCEEKAMLIPAFMRGSLPFAYDCLIELVGSANAAVSSGALALLARAKDPAVREFALSRLREGKRDPHTLSMLLRNYQADMEAFLPGLLETLVVDDENETGWHGVMMSITDAVGGGVLPASYLHTVYERSLCAGCRMNAVSLMIREGVLTEEIREECAFDSSEDVRHQLTAVGA